jgi:hypothetical protein
VGLLVRYGHVESSLAVDAAFRCHTIADDVGITAISAASHPVSDRYQGP